MKWFVRSGVFVSLAAAGLALALPGAAQVAPAQPSGAPPRVAPNGPPPGPMKIDPDPRVQQRTYHFKDTNEDLAYTVFVSSKVRKDKPAPLIVALHGFGGDSNFIVRGRLIDLAEEGGYVVTSPFNSDILTQAESLEEAFENARDVIALFEADRKAERGRKKKAGAR